MDLRITRIGMVLLLMSLLVMPGVESRVNDLEGDIAFDVSAPVFEEADPGNGTATDQMSFDVIVTNTGERTLDVALLPLAYGYDVVGVDDVTVEPDHFVMGPGTDRGCNVTVISIPQGRYSGSLFWVYFGLFWTNEDDPFPHGNLSVEDAHFFLYQVKGRYRVDVGSGTSSRTSPRFDYRHLPKILLSIQIALLVSTILVGRSRGRENN